MRFEFVWSLIVALFILSGAVAWTTASQPAPVQAVAKTAKHRPSAVGNRQSECRKYAQYEFKVGYMTAPGCLPHAD